MNAEPLKPDHLIYRVAAPIVICRRSLEFSDKEASLVRLVFDGSASPGEINNGAVALVRSLRRRYRSGHQFLNDVQSPPPPRPPESRDHFGAVIMPFGKYRGRQLRDIDPLYLDWVQRRCRNANPYLIRAIRRYLSN
jgi:hypothetical protein